MGWPVAAMLVGLAALAPGAPPDGPGDAFVDPLDLPAAPSALVPRVPLTAVAAAGDQLVAVGPRGLAIWSGDGGRRWVQGAVPVSTDLTAVHLASPRRGWAVGHDGVILATGDGGRTWQRQLDLRSLVPLLGAAERPPPAGQAEGALLAVWFDDERSGLAVGAFGLVLATEDGGRTWASWGGRVDDPRALHLLAVRRVGGALLVAGEQGLVLRLDPVHRRLVAVPAGARGSLFGLVGRGRTVVAFGLAGLALRSGDGGATWTPVETGVGEALTAGAAQPDGRLVVISGAGQVRSSQDDGRSFGPAGAGREAPRGGAVAGAAATADGALVLVGADGARRMAWP